MKATTALLLLLLVWHPLFLGCLGNSWWVVITFVFRVLFNYDDTCFVECYSPPPSPFCVAATDTFARLENDFKTQSLNNRINTTCVCYLVCVESTYQMGSMVLVECKDSKVRVGINFDSYWHLQSASKWIRINVRLIESPRTRANLKQWRRDISLLNLIILFIHDLIESKTGPKLNRYNFKAVEVYNTENTVILNSFFKNILEHIHWYNRIT